MAYYYSETTKEARESLFSFKASEKTNDPEKLKELSQYHRFVKTNLHVLAIEPDYIWQFALLQPNYTVTYNEAGNISLSLLSICMRY